MNTRSLLATALALAASACTSLDPSEDRDEVHAELRTRASVDVALPALDDDAALAEEVRVLLATPLDAERAVRVALLQNRRVRSLYEALGVGRAELVQAGLIRNPTFDFDARFLEGGGTDLEFGLSQPILELFFLPLRKRLAEHEYAAAKLRVTEELVSLCFAVRRAFARARAAAALVEVEARALRTAAASHELMRLLHAAGNATDAELAIERAGETRARLDLAATEQAAVEAREPVQALLGLWGEHTQWSLVAEPLTESALALDTSRIEARAVEASLDLRAQREGLNSLAQQAGLDTWRGWFPELALGANGIRIPGGTWGFGPRLEGELPLFDQGSSRRARSAAQLRAGMHDFAQSAVELRAGARLLQERLLRLLERARFLRDVHLPQRAEVVRTTLQNYNAMQIGAFEVLTQRRAELRDQRELVLVLREAELAQLDMRELLAGSMPEALRRRLRGAEEEEELAGNARAERS
ncbi:MAG: TolC family protein [Planctomycetes bacterium]|nr:TolC family protein [Planctomycetota bacterium]